MIQFHGLPNCSYEMKTLMPLVKDRVRPDERAEGRIPRSSALDQFPQGSSTIPKLNYENN